MPGTTDPGKVGGREVRHAVDVDGVDGGSVRLREPFDEGWEAPREFSACDCGVFGERVSGHPVERPVVEADRLGIAPFAIVVNEGVAGHPIQPRHGVTEVTRPLTYQTEHDVLSQVLRDLRVSDSARDERPQAFRVRSAIPCGTPSPVRRTVRQTPERVGQMGLLSGRAWRATYCGILDTENPVLGCWVGDVFVARFGDVDRRPGR